MKKNKWPLILAAIINLIFFLRTFTLYAKHILNFPVDMYNDFSVHAANIFFFIKYGFLKTVPNWFGGYTNFLNYPPGFAFFNYPFMILFQKVEISILISLCLLFIICFLGCVLIGKLQKKKIKDELIFYSLVFLNPLTIGNLILVGYFTEFLGWAFFILTFGVLYLYLQKKVDIFFIIIISLFLFLIIISHPIISLFSFIFLGSLFIIKNGKERLKIILSAIIPLIASLFWTLPFLTMYKFQQRPKLLTTITKLNLDSITTIIIPLIFLILIYLYLKKERKEEKIFFIGPIIIAILLITRAILIIPFLYYIHADTYNLFFIFLIFFLIIFKDLKIPHKKIVYFLILLITIFSIILYFTIINEKFYFTENEVLTKEILKEVNKKFIIVPELKIFAQAYYSYGAIYYNLSTPDGWLPEARDTALSKELDKEIINMIENIECFKLEKASKVIDFKQIITYGKKCKKLEKCNFKQIIKNKDICLIEITQDTSNKGYVPKDLLYNETPQKNHL